MLKYILIRKTGRQDSRLACLKGKNLTYSNTNSFHHKSFEKPRLGGL
jgi:hypothetical protein